MKAKSTSKEVKSAETKTLNAKRPKTQEEIPSKPTTSIKPIEVEESTSDLENEFLEEEAYNELMESDSDDNVPRPHSRPTAF